MKPEARARTQKVINLRESWIPKINHDPLVLARSGIDKDRLREDALGFSWMQKYSSLPHATILAKVEKEMPILEGVELLRAIEGLEKTHRFGMSLGERAEWEGERRRAMVEAMQKC
jgi:hypothetical protein